MTSPVDSQPKLTLAEKVWRDHVVTHGTGDEPDLIFIDLQLLHEVTSPQAFDGLRLAGRTLRHPELHLATEDHNVPTTGIKTGDLTEIADSISRTQVSTLRKNCEEFGVRLHAMGDINQGIVHQVGPQLGATQPGTTIMRTVSATVWPFMMWAAVRRSSMRALVQEPRKTVSILMSRRGVPGVRPM